MVLYALGSSVTTSTPAPLRLYHTFSLRLLTITLYITTHTSLFSLVLLNATRLRSRLLSAVALPVPATSFRRSWLLSRPAGSLESAHLPTKNELR
jgi:hypothetical protein